MKSVILLRNIKLSIRRRYVFFDECEFCCTRWRRRFQSYESLNIFHTLRIKHSLKLLMPFPPREKFWKNSTRVIAAHAFSARSKILRIRTLFPLWLKMIFTLFNFNFAGRKGLLSTRLIAEVCHIYLRNFWKIILCDLCVCSSSRRRRLWGYDLDVW